jgi:hypothetical protein
MAAIAYIPDNVMIRWPYESVFNAKHNGISIIINVTIKSLEYSEDIRFSFELLPQINLTGEKKELIKGL